MKICIRAFMGYEFVDVDMSDDFRSG